MRAAPWAGACDTCLLRVGALSDADASIGSGDALPDNFSQPYTLTVRAM